MALCFIRPLLLVIFLYLSFCIKDVHLREMLHDKSFLYLLYLFTLVYWVLNLYKSGLDHSDRNFCLYEIPFF